MSGLGKDRPISRLGLGTWAFGGTGWGKQDDRYSRLAILRAVELGVDWIDTAAVYGDGHAERLVGEALSDLAAADRPLVFTKGGVRVDPRSGRTFRDLRPRALREQCEASLRRLGLERLDVYQIHWPTEDGEGIDAAWETLAELAEDGKTRWIGVSNFSRDQLCRCHDLRPLDTVQPSLSLLDRDACIEIIPWAAAHEVALITYSPLASGLLSGRFDARRLATLGEGDWRGRRPEFQSPAFERALALVERLRPLAVRLGVSLAELAIGWVVSQPGVTSAIVGARSPAQVEGFIGAMGLELSEETLQEIALACMQTKAGKGPVMSRS